VRTLNFFIMLTKVIFEYSDGRKKYLDGEDLQRWNTYCEQVAISAMIHNMNPPWENVKWKEERQIDTHEQKNTKENSEPENTGKEN
jgi:hypothetical protein